MSKPPVSLTVLSGGTPARLRPPSVVLAPPERRATLLHIVAARSDVVILAPVVAALERRHAFDQIVVHAGTGPQRGRWEQVAIDLRMGPPDRWLDAGTGGRVERMARMLLAFENLVEETRPAAVVVAGDADGALACALVTAKLGIPVAHIEAGLRAVDAPASDERNQVLIDALSDLLFTHGPIAHGNLVAEGVPPGRIAHVGCTLIDSLRRSERQARARRAWEDAGVGEREYVLVLLQQPANIEEPGRFAAILDRLVVLAERFPVVFLTGPRIRARLDESDVARLSAAGVRTLETDGYLESLSLKAGAGAVITDSGAVQDEASGLGVRCWTLRSFTERPITVSHGTNVLLGSDPESLAGVWPDIGEPTPAAIPLWDGHAGERVAAALVSHYALMQVVGRG